MAKHNKITKSFPMWPKGSITIAQFSEYEITIIRTGDPFYVKNTKMLSLSLVAEALTDLIYHRLRGTIPAFSSNIKIEGIKCLKSNFCQGPRGSLCN